MKKQSVVILMVIFALAMTFVVGCTGYAVSATSPSSAISTAAKTSRTSPTPYATTPIPSVSAGNRSDVSANEIVFTGALLGGLITAGGFIVAASLGACGAVSAAFIGAIIGGFFALGAAGIGIIPGILAVGVSVAIALGLLK